MKSRGERRANATTRKPVGSKPKSAADKLADAVARDSNEDLASVGKTLSRRKEAVEIRVNALVRLVSLHPDMTFPRVLEYCKKAWGVSEGTAKNYWAATLDRIRELGNPEIGLVRGKLVGLAMEFIERYQHKEENPDVVLSAMRFVADILGLNRLQVERLRMDLERYERALKIEEEKLRLLGAVGDGQYASDGFDEAMKAAAEKVLKRGIIIEGDVVNEEKKDTDT